MSNDDRQHQMDFILKQQAAFSADIEQLKEVQRQQAENINQLTKNVEAMREEMQEGFTNLIHANEAMREEMQGGFNKLILANEITRKLTEDVARLMVGVSQRVTKLEQE